MDPSPLSKADKPKDRKRVAQGPSSSQDKGGGFPGRGGVEQGAADTPWRPGSQRSRWQLSSTRTEFPSRQPLKGRQCEWLCPHAPGRELRTPTLPGLAEASQQGVPSPGLKGEPYEPRIPVSFEDLGQV